jgi:hypothetical protein
VEIFVKNEFLSIYGVDFQFITNHGSGKIMLLPIVQEQHLIYRDPIYKQNRFFKILYSTKWKRVKL